MAKSIREIKTKAESLTEQGNEADRKLKSCQASVSSATSQVAAARRRLAAASTTDAEGNPMGNPSAARVELQMAERRLASSKRELSSAESEAARVRSAKNAHVQEIAHHNQVERSNLEKLRRLQSMAFGENASALAEGIAQRLNEAEDVRVALLRSMGMEASADYAPAGGGGQSGSGWRGGNFAALDISGQGQRLQGGGGGFEGNVTGGPVAAPVGGGLVSHGPDMQSPNNFGTDNIITNDNGQAAHEAAAGTGSGTGAKPDSRNAPFAGEADYLDSLAASIARAWTDSSMPIDERLATLTAYRNLLNCYKQREASIGNDLSAGEKVKVLRKSAKQISDEGHRYIDNILDVYRDNLIQLGITDQEIINARLNSYRQQYTEILNQDIRDGTFHLYDHPIPDFKSLAKELDLACVEKKLYKEFGASLVQLDGFDPHVAHDMADALVEAKHDFPGLQIRYFGSCQSQLTSIKHDVTEFYTQFFAQIRQPNWTDADFKAVVKANTDRIFHDLEIDKTYADLPATFAWSWNVGAINDPVSTALKKYSGISVNLQYGKDYASFKKEKEHEVASKHKPIGCDTPRATMDHELGHEIDKLLGASRDPVIIRLYNEMVSNNNAEDVLSGYSKTNIQEFIAEGYSEYRNNKAPRKLASDIYNRLIELRNNKAGGSHV